MTENGRCLPPRWFWCLQLLQWFGWKGRCKRRLEKTPAFRRRQTASPVSDPDIELTLPDAPYLHLFVPRGAVTLEGAGPLATGDAVRFTATGGQKVTATEEAEVLVWEMHATLAA